MENDKQTTNSQFDLFSWANQAEARKKDFQIEIYLFNRFFTPFRLNLSPEVESQAKTIFLYDLINAVNQGAETGLSVIPYEVVDKTKDVVMTVALDQVERASYLVDFLKNRQNEIADYSFDEYGFKIKGVVAKITLSDGPGSDTYYIAKNLSVSQTVSGATAWQLNSNKIESLASDVALKMPLDNQSIIIGKQVFVFNSAKFESLFSYDYQKTMIAEAKIKEIESKYQLSLPDGLTIQTLVRERKRTLAKLQKLEVPDMKQEDVIDYADAMQLELMSDENGAIIIMDGNDLDMFLGLLNEDYVMTSVSNKRYEVLSKKAMGEPEGEAPRG